MKVGILTRHHIYNYGAVLQSYALQEILKDFGCGVEIIDYRHSSFERNCKVIYLPAFPHDVSLISFGEYLISVCKHVVASILNIDQRFLLKSVFESFIHQRLLLSPKIYTNEVEISKYYPVYDAYISGSDQVWRVNSETGTIDLPFFLTFVPPGCIRIAYAVSMGRSSIPLNCLNDFKQAVSHVDYISVREKSAVDFVNSCTSRDVVSVLDPVFLLKRGRWESLAKCSSQKCPKEKYLLVYSVSPDPRLRYISRVISEKNSLRTIYIGRDYHHRVYRTSFVSLEEYLWLFMHAEMILTNSFHGTVFSIIFQKQFFVLPPDGEETRIIDVLDLFGLKNRLLLSKNDSIDDLEGIDYGGVFSTLKSERKKSLDFLRDALFSQKQEDT